MRIVKMLGLFLSAALFFGCTPSAVNTPQVSNTPFIEETTPEPTAEPTLLWRSYIGRNLGSLSDAVTEAVIRLLYTSCGAREDAMRTVDFYAVEPFGDGVLVLYEQQQVAESALALCYLERDNAISLTTNADCWSVNVSRLFGKTLVFGRTLTAEPAVTSVTATFGDGSKTDATLFSGTADPQNVTASNPAALGDVFLIVSGESAGTLAGLEFFSGEASVGTAASDAFRQAAAKNGIPLPWAGTQHELYDRIRFCPMQTRALPQGDDQPLLVCSSYVTPLTVAEKHGMLLSDVWCSNLGGTVGVPAENGFVQIDRLPEDVQALYLLLPGTNDDELGLSGDRIVQTAVKDGRIAIPENVQNMRLRLVLETEDCYYIATVLCP